MFSPSLESVCGEAVRRSLSLALLRDGLKVLVLKCHMRVILWDNKCAENSAGNDLFESSIFLLAPGLASCVKYHHHKWLQGWMTLACAYCQLWTYKTAPSLAYLDIDLAQIGFGPCDKPGPVKCHSLELVLHQFRDPCGAQNEHPIHAAF